MATVFYITHPEVVIDPAVPVPRWSLSDRGRARMAALAALPAFAEVRLVWSSSERKALDGAAILADALGVDATAAEDLDEIDRSAKGFVPEPQFTALADALFARPTDSVEGWERAVDAQARVAAALVRCLAASPAGDLVFVGHGGVGTLLHCHLTDAPIAKNPKVGFGSWFGFDRDTRALVCEWTRPPAA